MKPLAPQILALCVALSACQPDRSAPNAVPGSSALAGGAESCEALIGTKIGPTIIDQAEWVERGDSLVGLVMRWLVWIKTLGGLQLVAAADQCHITATARPVDGSKIKIGVWLPDPWNGKLLGLGGFGFNGGVEVAGMTSMEILGQGYAVMATDAGHEPTDSAKFAHNAPESLIDYGYRANHVGTDFAKALIKKHYAKSVQRAYFHGCSNGGRDALMLAQRYPEDYDGIIVGAPALNFTNLMSRFIWNRQAVESVPALGNKLELLHNAVMEQCDALDGVSDGLLENPLRCPFNPADLQCKSGDSPRCLSAEEVDAVRKIYEGPRLSDGTRIYSGQPVGAEFLQGGWDEWVIDQGHSEGGPEIYRWAVHRDPKWDVRRFDLARDTALANERIGAIVNATDPDLGPFMRRGGKLMMYHGWNDVATPAGETLDYYAAVLKTVGEVADQQARLFMIPGLLHCANGPGATTFDKLAEMDRWVDTGIAPERILATEWDPPAATIVMSNAKKVRTRPICAWPKVATYKGSGSTDEAASFVCQ